MSTYEQDFAKAVQKQSDLIVQRVFIELIQLVTESETYEDFRKRMYSLALSYIKDLESSGIKIPEQPETEKKPVSEDDICMKYYTYWSIIHGLISINLVRPNGRTTDELNQQILKDAIKGITLSING
jgi:predicted RNase H-like HicB family nuclease